MGGEGRGPRLRAEENQDPKPSLLYSFANNKQPAYEIWGCEDTRCF